jgi:hypothetical protein
MKPPEIMAPQSVYNWTSSPAGDAGVFSSEFVHSIGASYKAAAVVTRVGLYTRPCRCAQGLRRKWPRGHGRTSVARPSGVGDAAGGMADAIMR